MLFLLIYWLRVCLRLTSRCLGVYLVVLISFVHLKSLGCFNLIYNLVFIYDVSVFTT